MKLGLRRWCPKSWLPPFAWLCSFIEFPSRSIYLRTLRISPLKFASVDTEVSALNVDWNLMSKTADITCGLQSSYLSLLRDMYLPISFCDIFHNGEKILLDIFSSFYISYICTYRILLWNLQMRMNDTGGMLSWIWIHSCLLICGE